MMKKLGSKLSSKSSGSHGSASSSITDSLFAVSKNSHISNPIPEFQRQEIPPHQLLELRLACAAIVKETGPSGAELEAILNQADPLEQYKKDQQHKKDIDKIRLQAARTHASAFPPVKGARDRDRLSKSNLESMNASSTSLAISPQPPAKQPNHRPLIPVAPKHKPIETAELPSRQVSRKPVPGRDDEKPIPRSRPQPDSRRPEDHRTGRTGQSSTSTTRSNTTFDHHASTSQTSFNHTPAENKRSSSQHPLRSSSRQAIRTLRQDDNNSMLSDTDFFSPNPDYDVPSLYHVKIVSQGPSRARSRAGSIKDSIIGGIRDYIQPRPSMDMSRPQSRQSRSATRDPSRTPSRSSSMTRNSKEWMRNAASSLRRKGSISSLQSSLSRNGDDEDRGRNSRRDKGPDLNRKLPPLPGLDSYKEPKKHIAQLLAKSKFSSKSQQPQPQQAPQPREQVFSPQEARSALPDSHTSPYFTTNQAPSTQTITQASALQSPGSTSSAQFPRIPFSEHSSNGQPSSNTESPPDLPIQTPQPLSSHKPPKSSEILIPSYAQEDELRRVVREKITQGGLSKEQFEAQQQRDSRHLNLLRSRSGAKDPWETEQLSSAGYISATAMSPPPATDSRGGGHKRAKSVVGNGKSNGEKKSQGFRGRFSKLMGSGHHGQNSVVVSH